MGRSSQTISSRRRLLATIAQPQQIARGRVSVAILDGRRLSLRRSAVNVDLNRGGMDVLVEAEHALQQLLLADGRASVAQEQSPGPRARAVSGRLWPRAKNSRLLVSRADRPQARPSGSCCRPCGAVGHGFGPPARATSNGFAGYSSAPQSSPETRLGRVSVTVRSGPAWSPPLARRRITSEPAKAG